MRVRNSPDWDKVIASLETLKDPAVFQDALHIASAAAATAKDDGNWLASLKSQLLGLSRSSAPLATVLAQVGFDADAAVDTSLCIYELLAALSSAKATAEAKVLQAAFVSKSARQGPRGRPRKDKSAKVEKAPSLRMVARLFGKKLEVNQTSSAKGSALKRQAPLGSANQDGQDASSPTAGPAAALRRMRRRKGEDPFETGSSQCDVCHERGKGIPIKKVIEIYDFIKTCPPKTSVGKLVLREFSETLKGWTTFTGISRLVEKCERLRYKNMPDWLKNKCFAPNWWKEALGDPSLKLTGRNEHFYLPEPLQQQLDSLHCQRSIGAKSGVSEIVPLRSLSMEAKKLSKAYNEKAIAANIACDEANSATWREVLDGGLDLREAMARYIPPAPLARGNFSKHWASRFRKNGGSLIALSTRPGFICSMMIHTWSPAGLLRSGASRMRVSTWSCSSSMTNCGRRSTVGRRKRRTSQRSSAG